ncbi:MAG: sarcosine oxidase subunit gamma [Fulvimarina manganoxydans]|uniref:sarcosine oxidase subunit gamma n=1 Tax=Fulvimarina manganoxydans TaxID=937218 RepID=UPI0023551E6F|nr:sarcosine oxidase subunit gamma family protein [Fulvimarina manganoxydans]MCK5932285.1 sarcosine oxidase subunit gamma [Fulvimarina manganoxydans]
MAETQLTPVEAFDGLLKSVGDPRPAGVRVRERSTLALATVMVRKGRRTDLASRISERFGCDLPSAGRRTEANDLALVSTGPGAWLACREAGGYEFSEGLGETLSGLASVTDQSDAFAILRLSGPRVKAVLAKGVFLDLADEAFPEGHAAVTQCGHVGVTLWRLASEEADDPVYEVAMFRSYAESFWHWLSLSAAEYGLTVERT